jgi:hypothetical protein
MEFATQLDAIQFLYKNQQYADAIVFVQRNAFNTQVKKGEQSSVSPMACVRPTTRLTVSVACCEEDEEKQECERIICQGRVEFKKRCMMYNRLVEGKQDVGMLDSLPDDVRAKIACMLM